MISPSSSTFRTSPVEIIRSGRDIWRTACGKKSSRCKARSRSNCRNSMLFSFFKYAWLLTSNAAAQPRAEATSAGTAGWAASSEASILTSRARSHLPFCFLRIESVYPARVMDGPLRIICVREDLFLILATTALWARFCDGSYHRSRLPGASDEQWQVQGKPPRRSRSNWRATRGRAICCHRGSDNHGRVAARLKTTVSAWLSAGW